MADAGSGVYDLEKTPKNKPGWRKSIMDLTQTNHAFITGGASGIGLGIADALVKRGVPVTIVDIDEEAVRAVVAERSGRLRGQVLDVRDRSAWVAAKAEAEAALGPVDLLVANAGIGPDGEELADVNPASFDLIMAINVGGIFNSITAFAGDMRERRRGHIVITGSMAGLASQQVGRIGAYTASKFAVVALGETLRGEMAAHGVGVSILCPGMVITNLGRSAKRVGLRSRPLAGEPSRGGAPLMAAMQPSEVGEITVAGIERDHAYIVTHPGDWPQVEARYQALRAAFAPA
jgi:NAD(P)-dependent dehydrogenase (short-subunit alcohol dehydrogenase family)